MYNLDLDCFLDILLANFFYYKLEYPIRQYVYHVVLRVNIIHFNMNNVNKMQAQSVQDVTISKPKKDGSTYFAPIHIRKKQAFTIDITDAQCFTTSSSNIVYVKNKHFLHYLVDLNDHIVDIVKSNCASWFNSNMDTELIEEYYINPVKYDKRYGDIIKIELCKGLDTSVLEAGSAKKFDIVIEVKGLRFLKQKFSLEWNIIQLDAAEDIQFCMSDNDLSSEEEDLPEPIPEDITEAKDNVIQRINALENKFEKQIEEITNAMERIKTLKEALFDISTLNQLSELELEVESYFA